MEVQHISHSFDKQNQQSLAHKSLANLSLKPIHSNDNYQKKGLFKLIRGGSGNLPAGCEQVQMKVNISLIRQYSDKNDKFWSNNKKENAQKINSDKIVQKDYTLNEDYLKKDKPNLNLLKVLKNLQKYKHQHEQFSILNTSNQNHSIQKNINPNHSNKKLCPLRQYSQASLSKFSTQPSALNELSLSIGAEKPLVVEKKIKKVKKVVQKKQVESECSSDEDIEYDDDAIPGPGYYSYEDFNKKKQFRSKKDKFKQIFYSPIERFHLPPSSVPIAQDFMPSEALQPNQTHKIKPSATFISKTCKIPEYLDSGIPPPGSYNTRQTLENDIVKNILKSSNTNIFISQQPRQAKTLGQDRPGPGQYTLDRSLQKLQQQYDSCSSAFKSGEAPRVHYAYRQGCDLIKMSKDLQVKQIHVKNQLDQPTYLPLPPPFLSSSSRFPALKFNVVEPIVTLPAQKPSAKKQSGGWKMGKGEVGRGTDWCVGEGLGVGIYDIAGGLKKSFNVRNN